MTVSSVMVALLVVGDKTIVHSQTSPLSGFVDSVVLSGLELPTVMAFSLDGRIFVAEKSGLIKVFDNLADQSARVFADLRTQVHNFGDRGLLGMALHPNFPTTPYLYVLYTRDAPIGGTAPRWGAPATTSDGCPMPADDGCVASGRLSRLEVSPSSTLVGAEHVLIDDWFQQFDSHSIGSIAFGPDGALYASGGDAASWQFVDYGQEGNPRNPAGDPPVAIGGVQTPPTAEGGALRSQDLRTDADPVGLNGTVIRINPDTAAAMPDNPLSFHRDANARRIVAYGVRNPFRIAVRPGTREVWVGDVGWREHEEINIIPDPATMAAPRNFGWPCYDGTSRQPGYDAANLNICENLYADAGAVTFAHFQYREGTRVVAGEACGFTNSSTSGLAFYTGGSYPPEYDGALFFGDYTRRCIWVMYPGSDGVPNPATRKTFIASAATPVDLKIGPGGDLFYVDIAAGAIHRIQFNAGNEPPEAAVTASPDSGRSPLTVTFNAAASSDPEGGPLTYDWDFDGNGVFGEATTASPSHTYTVNATYNATVRVTDGGGLRDTATVTVTVGNTAPTPVIDTPAATLRWHVGQNVSFSGRAPDVEDGTVAASGLKWSLIMNHCSSPSSCHEHFIQDFPGIASGTFVAPTHDYPSFLSLRLTARDSGGLERTVARRLDPQPVNLTFETSPPGLQLTLGARAFTAPETQTVIVGSSNSISAPSPQSLGGTGYEFVSWSNGGGQTQLVTAPAVPTTYTATFRPIALTLPPSWLSRDIGSVGVAGSSSHSGGTFTIRGAGADVWGTADAFQYAYQTLNGNGTIVARVASVSGSDAWTKVGVMMRGSIDPGAAHAFMLVSTGKGLAFQRRTTAAGVSTNTSGGTGTAPRWVRLVRAGNVVTASVSLDGTTWATVGQDTIALPTNALVGLAVSSHRTSALASATFDNVTVTMPQAPLPVGWQRSDIGSVGQAGSSSESAGTFTVRGAGADVWGTSDAFHYAYRTVTGDADIVARVATVSGAEPWTKVGVMIRDSVAANSAHAFMLVSTSRGLAFQRRVAAGGVSTNTGVGTGTAPRWVKLSRRGNAITASVSTNGSTWSVVGSDTIPMTGEVHAGLAVSSHDTAQLATGTFDNVAVLTPLPAGWNATDVGAVGRSGSTSESGGTFTVSGAGADVWGTADGFHFAYRTLAGDGEIVARVAAVSGTHEWTKVGVMIRQAVAANSPHAFMLVSRAKGISFQRRTAAGAVSTASTTAGITAPQWVRLTRAGTLVTASVSSNGTTWTDVGSDTIAFSGSVLVGLAVTSHTTSQLATATFENVVITP